MKGKPPNLPNLFLVSTVRCTVCPQIHVYLGQQNVSLFANRVFADIVEMTSHWIRVRPKSNDWCSYKKGT